ncbi:MAG: IS110 family transposase [Anaerolineales bacterium]|nr:IS110 family transposase [Anaerolineales bacterium]
MITEDTSPSRFIGLDIHKHYLIAIGVDENLNQVFGPQRVEMTRLESWITKTLNSNDAVAVEMTTNTWEVYDDLEPHVHSITVVHPPHVALITRAQVMTDKIAASILARLLAKGLLVGIWVPPVEVRELRALIAHRSKMIRLSSQAKNRLHAVLHRHHITPPAGGLFHKDQHPWWRGLDLSPSEKTTLLCDLDTLIFSEQQVKRIEKSLKAIAAQDDRIPFLVQIPGINLVNALTILGAIGTIHRFPTAKKLVGYSGLGGRIHESGKTSRSGRITKAGRRDLRTAMVQAAQTAANSHPHWKAELNRLQPRLGRNKAIVAIARKLLVATWHVLSKETADRFAEPEIVARKMMQFAYTMGKPNRPSGQSTAEYVRVNLDRLEIGMELTEIPWGTKKPPIPLPSSTHKPR